MNEIINFRTKNIFKKVKFEAKILSYENSLNCPVNRKYDRVCENNIYFWYNESKTIFAVIKWFVW
jgi:hypothetical protein